MFACRVLIGFALVGMVAASHHARASLPPSERKPLPEQSPNDCISLRIDPFAEKKSSVDRSPKVNARAELSDGKPVWELGTVGHEFYTKGQYKEALDAYTRWQPRSFCGNCCAALRSERRCGIAFCYIQLNDYPSAVRVCLEPVAHKFWDFILGGDVDALLVRIYAEAEQLNDLRRLLNAIEQVAIESHPKWWLLTPAERTQMLRELRTHGVRRRIAELKPNELKPWPADLPKPKPGSLPKTLKRLPE